MDADGTAHFKRHAKESENITKQAMKRLKFDNDTLRKVTKLVQYHDYRMPAEAKSVRRAVNKIGEDLFPSYLEVRRADVLAQSLYLREEKIGDIEQVQQLYQEIKEQNQCVSMKDLAVSGKDLIEAGMDQGPELGEALGRLLELVLENPDLNTKEELLRHL